MERTIFRTAEETTDEEGMHMGEDGLRPLPQNRFLRGVYLMARRYLDHSVSIQSAALAFYLLFTIFPLMIFFSALLGLLHIDATDILTAIARFLPTDVIALLEMYFAYVQRDPNLRLMLFGLFFSIYFPMRAANTLMRAARTAYHLGPPRAALRHIIKTLLYTILLIVTIVLALVLLSVGRLALGYAVEHFHFPQELAELWTRLRFPVMALLMYFAIYFLYAITQDERQPQRNLWPGALAALLGWLLASYFFSCYVENIAAYSLLYGSIGAVIVLLMWLYLTATFLIMGAELNGTLISLHKERQARSI
jgi:membrane protein